MTRPFNETTKLIVSIHSETWSEEDVEAGEASVTSTEIDAEVYSPEQLVTLAADHGIDSASASDPHGGANVWFTSSSPRQDRAHIETGESTFFSLHIQSIDDKPLTDIGIQRIADLIGVEFSRPIEIAAMPDAIVSTSDGKVTAVLNAEPWLAKATPGEIAGLLESDFTDCEVADEIYYQALQDQYPQARALAAHLLSPANAVCGFDVTLDGAEIMRWLEENRIEMHAQFAPDPERAIFGYYINLDERGEFYADVRNAEGSTVFEFRYDGTDEDTLFSDGTMAHKDDIMGLKTHLMDMNILKRDDLLMDMPAFEAELEKRKSAEPNPYF